MFLMPQISKKRQNLLVIIKNRLEAISTSYPKVDKMGVKPVIIKILKMTSICILIQIEIINNKITFTPFNL